MEQACRRLAWAKYTNAGQTCVAPDYLFAPPEQIDVLVEGIGKSIKQMYGSAAEESPDYGRIINAAHFLRLKGLLKDAPIRVGGRCQEDDRFIEPTVVVFGSIEEAKSHPLMGEEIFGPILPIIPASFDEAINYVNAQPDALTAYAFTDDIGQYRRMIAETSSGSLARNVGLLQAGATTIPFGGVGASGMGRYHGKETWKLFSNRKIIVSKPLRPDTLRLIQPPTKRWVRRSLSWISRSQ